MARGDAAVRLEELVPWLRRARIGLYDLESADPGMSDALRAEIARRRSVYQACEDAVRETIRLRDRSATGSRD